MSQVVSARLLSAYLLGASALTCSSLLAGSLLSLPASARQVGNGLIIFDKTPRLVRVAASTPAINTPAIYEFTIAVPADAGEPLQAVTIAQDRDTGSSIAFEMNQSLAFAGNHYRAGASVPLASVGGDQPVNPGEATIVFAQPVQPGNTVTVVLQSQRNPSQEGVYFFGVTAYPAGDKGVGQFLGYGRLNFFSNAR